MLSLWYNFSCAFSLFRLPFSHEPCQYVLWYGRQRETFRLSSGERIEIKIKRVGRRVNTSFSKTNKTSGVRKVMDVCDKKQSIIKDEWKLLNNSSVVKWTSRNIRTSHVLSLERKFIPSDMIWSGAIIMERWKCQVRSWGFIRVMNILESHMRNFNWNKKYDEKLLSLKIFAKEKVAINEDKFRAEVTQKSLKNTALMFE